MIAPVQDTSPKVPLALPDPASIETPGGAQDVAAMLRQAFNANETSHAMAVDISETFDTHQAVAPYTANAIAGPSTQDHQAHIVLTQPGSQILTPQAQELADMFIDHTQFPDGVSPLTQIHRLQTPERLDTPLTTEELQRLMSSTTLDVSRPVTPANPTIEVIPQQHDGIEAESDVEMTIRDIETAEDVFIIGNGGVIIRNGGVIGEDVGADGTEKEGQAMVQDGAAREEVQGMQEDGAEEDEAQGMQEDGPKEVEGAPDTAEDDNTAPPSSTTSATPSPHTHQLQPSTPGASRPLRVRRPPLRAVSEDMIDSEDSDSDTEPEAAPPPKSANSTVATASRQQVDRRSGSDSTAQIGQDPDATDTIVANAEGFKLSLEGTLRSVVRGPATILKQAAVPMVEKGFTIKVFPLDPTANATDFEFRTHKNVVSNVYILLHLA